ncbi:MAG TPA: UDP-N-acetylmuramoyl-L-alanine--D-glutamate ligase [Acidimicrobiales bacterium]|jgi:UDP-N-acetylmuramoylalanine--D-glutamate ligase|nr:UDP-N-acetylmuramoyl-L-alanine--D-glutamate ligase [Acidimicrobiales bacterium]
MTGRSEVQQAAVTGAALVYGLAVTGEATAAALIRRGWAVLAADDAAGAAGAAERLGLDLAVSPDAGQLAGLLDAVELVVPAPGLPEHHPLFAEARRRGLPVRSEIDLAWEWEQRRAHGPRPILAITGTDGKTTTTLLATAMLHAGGCRAVAAGNTETPLVDALELDVDAFVVECSSFRLAWTACFRPDVGTWLNFAADHLDWHRDVDSYEAAKASLWRFQTEDDTAIGNAADAVVCRHLAAVRAKRRMFGAGGDYRVDGDQLVGPHGPIVPVARMSRRLPHDLDNGLAAAATVLESRLVGPDAVAEALTAFRAPRHRIELVAERAGVAWYDDSKATTPHAALTAIRAFPSVVLIAGGKNKGLDLAALSAEAPRLRGVVAIGAAAAEVEAVFAGRVGVVTAGSMDDAVRLAAERAASGDAVLLSPACASFDWYASYGERGDDFARAVRDHLGVTA